MGPIGHTAVSLGIGAGVWAATGEPLALPAALATGALNDADHLIDYAQWYVKKDLRRVYLVFHAWEYVIVGLVITLSVWQHPAIVAATLGHLGHLVGDQVANRPKSLLTYSLVYRVRSGFDRERLFGRSESTLSEVLHRLIPFWRVIEPRLPARIARFLELSH